MAGVDWPMCAGCLKWEVLCCRCVHACMCACMLNAGARGPLESGGSVFCKPWPGTQTHCQSAGQEETRSARSKAALPAAPPAKEGGGWGERGVPQVYVHWWAPKILQLPVFAHAPCLRDLGAAELMTALLLGKHPAAGNCGSRAACACARAWSVAAGTQACGERPPGRSLITRAATRWR
jgi:hypothetical protein